MKNPINNSVFDSRDLIEYKDELAEDLLNSYNEFMQELHDNDEELGEWEDVEDVDDLKNAEFESVYQTEIEEFTEVKNFCDELENYGDFTYGEVIICEDYWEEYCEEMCKDCGYLSDKLPSFISNNIDWEGVANELSVDYITATYEGKCYYMRT